MNLAHGSAVDGGYSCSLCRRVVPGFAHFRKHRPAASLIVWYADMIEGRPTTPGANALALVGLHRPRVFRGAEEMWTARFGPITPSPWRPCAGR